LCPKNKTINSRYAINKSGTSNEIRHYNIIRNGIYLLRLTYTPLRGDIFEFFKIIKRMLLFVCQSKFIKMLNVYVLKDFLTAFKVKLVFLLKGNNY